MEITNMTDKQAQDIGTFINTISEEDSTNLFEELIAGISLYFGTMEFAEIIETVYDDLTAKGLGIEEIAAEVKKQAPVSDDIYAHLTKELVDDDAAWEFAEGAVVSIVFNPAYPASITDELKKQEIEVEDFSANFIVSFREAFLDIFVNEMDIEEWKSDIIDALVASWD
jgi:hypothetical protein